MKRTERRTRGCRRSTSVWAEEEQPEILVRQQVALCSLTAVDAPYWWRRRSRRMRRKRRLLTEGLKPIVTSRLCQ